MNTNTRKIISWGLLAVGAFLLLTNAWESVPLLIGGVLLFFGTKFSTGHLQAFVILLVGGAAAAIGFLEDVEYLQMACGLFIGYLGFMKLLASDIHHGKTQKECYELHCKTYHLKPYSVQFYFMSEADEYIAIADDRKIYSYLDGTLKTVPTKNIDRIEKRGLDDSTNKSKYVFARVYEKNGNYHDYRFSKTTSDISRFVTCIEAIINFNDNPVVDGSVAEEWDRIEQLFKLGGVDDSIYPPDMYS